MVISDRSRTTRRGQSTSFQLAMNVRIATVMITGRERGQMIRKRIRRSEQPSILAASIRAPGMLRKNCLNRTMLNPLIIAGTMRERYVSVQPSFTIKIYCGMSVIWKGIIIVKRIRR